jgi:uridine phosphorylase
VDFKTSEVKPEHRALNILRIGTSGALHADIPLGSYVLAHISVGFDGVMNWYGNREKVTIPEVEEAFKKHMNWNPYLPSPYFVKASNKIIDLMKDVTLKGVTISAPGFYGPQGRIVRLPLAMPNMLEDVESFRFSTGGEDYRITNFEMESSPLAGLAAHLGHHASTVCCIIANRYLQSSNPDYKPAIRKLVELCLEKMSTL